MGFGAPDSSALAFAVTHIIVSAFSWSPPSVDFEGDRSYALILTFKDAREGLASGMCSLVLFHKRNRVVIACPKTFQGNPIITSILC